MPECYRCPRIRSHCTTSGQPKDSGKRNCTVELSDESRRDSLYGMKGTGIGAWDMHGLIAWRRPSLGANLPGGLRLSRNRKT